MDIDVRDQDNYDEELKEEDNAENMINMVFLYLKHICYRRLE